MLKEERKEGRRERFKRLDGRVRTFLSSDIWDMELSSLSRMRRTGVRTLRVLHLIVRGFMDDECPLHASALTFNTIMAIVPILALSLALARGFGNADAAKERIRQAVTEWTGAFREYPALVAQPDTRALAAEPDTSVLTVEDVEEAIARLSTADGGGADSPALGGEIERLLDEAFARVEELRFAALGTVGLILLLWMVVVVLGRVEFSFNRVWGVKRGRPLWRKFTDYLSAVLILPFLMLLASSLPVADYAAQWIPGKAGDYIQIFLASGLLKNAVMLTLSTLTFTFVIMFMPNTRVFPWAGLVGGFVTAIFFLTWLAICAALQVGVAKYGSLYGSFAVIPILLAWVHVSWQIVLFGAEVAFSVQNASTYRKELGAERASAETCLLLALGIMTDAARSMSAGPGPFDAATFARERRVPVRLMNTVLSDLVSEGFLGELSESPGRYALLRDPSTMRVDEIVKRMLRHGSAMADLGFQALAPAAAEVVRRSAVAAAGGGAAAHVETLGELASA